MTRLLFIGVLQCLAVLCCCELFVSGRLNIKDESSAGNMAGCERDAGRLYESGFKQ